MPKSLEEKLRAKRELADESWQERATSAKANDSPDGSWAERRNWAEYEARKACFAFWDSAIRAAEDHAYQFAIKTMQHAATIASDWGSDRYEQEAIVLLVVDSIRVVSQESTREGPDGGLDTDVVLVNREGEEATGCLGHTWEEDWGWVPYGGITDWISGGVLGVVQGMLGEDRALIMAALDDAARAMPRLRLVPFGEAGADRKTP